MQLLAIMRWFGCYDTVQQLLENDTTRKMTRGCVPALVATTNDTRQLSVGVEDT